MFRPGNPLDRLPPIALGAPAGHPEREERSLLDGATWRALSSINLAFLDLATELAEVGRLRQIAGLPSRAIDAFIDPEAAPRLCRRLPYSLFDLRFGDGTFWTAAAAAARDAQADGSHAATDERVVAFTRTVVMLVWHLAQTRPAAARLVFGASPAAIAAIAGTPVAAIDRLARRVAPAFAARFGSRTRFWLQFEGCAARPDSGSVDSLRRLGLQIQGAESARGQSLECRSL